MSPRAERLRGKRYTSIVDRVTLCYFRFGMIVPSARYYDWQADRVFLPYAMLPSKVILKALRRHLPAEVSAVLPGVMKMQSRKNARPVYLLEPIRGAVESVRVGAIAECGVVVHYNVNLGGPQKVRDKARRDSSNAPMRGRILRMIGSGRQRHPAPICHDLGIAAASADGGNRPPEVIGELRIPASDAGVRVSGPEDCEQPRRIHYIQFIVLGQIPKNAAILLSRMHSPEQANFTLRASADRAVRIPKEVGNVVFRNPSLTRQWRGPSGQELICAFQGKRTHLAEPRRECGQESRRCGLPDAWAAPRRIRHVGFESVTGAFRNQCSRRGLAGRSSVGLCLSRGD